MEEQRFLINGEVYAPHDPGLQDALARVYDTPARPLCLCVDGGVEMYVSKFRDFVIKRMPESGTEHAPTCPSYELPPSESGIGKLLGEAIIDRGPQGVELRLDFPLTRRVGRAAVVREPPSASDVTVARRQLSLRGLLHFLWDRAGFNRWYPRMQGKRSYAVVRKFLLHACEEVETKGLRLPERVFIPEAFLLDHAAEIAKRHREALSLLLSSESSLQFKMIIAIGELKDFKATPLGHRLVLKHLPECSFHLDERASKRMKKAFEPELLAWSARQVRLIAALLIYARQESWYQIESLSLIMTSAEWIPLDHAYEKDLVAKLVDEQRAFIKPLRYEAQHGGGFPNFLLLDVGARPMALDIVSAFLSEAERTAKLSAIARRDPKGWAWDTADASAMARLPARAIATYGLGGPSQESVAQAR